MCSKNIFGLFVIILSLSGSISAFTVINQTDSERTLELQEARRPAATPSGDLQAPVPLDRKPHKLTLPAKSIRTVQLQPCPVLLAKMVQTKKEGSSVKTTSSTTCYEPYSYQGLDETTLTDHWGLVIHNPLTQKLNDFWQELAREGTLKQGYGVKCLHPLLLEKVTSLDELPPELIPVSDASPLSSRKTK